MADCYFKLCLSDASANSLLTYLCTYVYQIHRSHRTLWRLWNHFDGMYMAEYNIANSLPSAIFRPICFIGQQCSALYADQFFSTCIAYPYN